MFPLLCRLAGQLDFTGGVPRPVVHLLWATCFRPSLGAGGVRALSIGRLGLFIGSLVRNSIQLSDITMANRVSGFGGRCRDKRCCFALGSRSTSVHYMVFHTGTSHIGFTIGSNLGIVVAKQMSLCRGSNRCRFCTRAVRRMKLNSVSLGFRRVGRGLRERNLFTRRGGEPVPGFPGQVTIVASSAKTTIRSVLGVATQHFPLYRVVLYPMTIRNRGTMPSVLGALSEMCRLSGYSMVVVKHNNNSVRSL